MTIEQQASDTQQHSIDSPHAHLISSLQKSFAAASAEHFPSYTIGVYPNSEQGVAILLVANKHSPTNFWNGRWRSIYLLQPGGSSIDGQIKVDVHYYEDGNVRMSTKKEVRIASSSDSADSIVREIAKAENTFQTELNRAFITLAEGSFKGLRRQLPVTRQRVEWEKIGGYRVSLTLMRGVNVADHGITAWTRHRWWTVKLELTSCCMEWLSSYRCRLPYEARVSQDRSQSLNCCQSALTETNALHLVCLAASHRLCKVGGGDCRNMASAKLPVSSVSITRK